ncbi:putative carboxylesterase [Xylaria castorea]|nr:putative carboxylesterase [Xylaria castorea]
MSSLLAALRCIRLKLLIGMIRLVVRLVTPRVHAKPDALLGIPSRDTGRTIKVHIYSPSPVTSPNGLSDASQTPRPVLINCFGSGFALPLFGADDSFCSEVSKRTGHVVLDVDYRLAPENPFPAAIHDIEDVVHYVLSRPDRYDIAHISISGFSSGGTLALVVPTLFSANTFRNVVTFYPSVNMAKDPSERKAPVEGPKSGRAPLSWTRLFREGYLGGMDPRDPRISPLFANTVNHPRNTLIVTAEYDTSASEAEEFAKSAEVNAQATDRRVILRRMRGCGHNFDKSKRNTTARAEAYGLAINLLNHSLKD